MTPTQSRVKCLGTPSNWGHAVLCLLGHDEDARDIMKSLVRVLSEYGDVLVSQYGDSDFGPEANAALVAAAVDSLARYSSVTIFAWSMGGMLVDELVRAINQRRPKIVVTVISPAGILTSKDVAVPVSLMAKLCSSRLTSRPMARAIDLVTSMARIAVEAGVSKARLDAHRRAKREFPNSRRVSELRFMARAQLPQSDNEATACVYLQPGQRQLGLKGRHDGLVYGRAAQRWRRHYFQTVIIECPELYHCTFVEQPEAWAERIRQAMCLLDIWPVAP